MLSQPKVVYGIHSFSPYNRTTGEFYGSLKVLKGSTFSLEGETQELMGGSSKYAWAVEDGTISSELSLTFAEYPDFMFELFLGKRPEELSAEISGAIANAANKKGTSILSATNGIEIEPLVGSEAKLKFGKYVLKAVSANTFNVFASSDIDFSRGGVASFVNDSLKINESPLSVATVDAELALFGLKFKLNGTAAFVTGDTVTFEVRPVNAGSSSVTVGALSDIFPEFGAVLYAQKRGSQEMFELDVFKLKALGMPFNFNPQEFSEAEVTAKASYDASKGGIFQIRSIKF